MAEKAEKATELLKALANETRLMLLCSLSHGEKSVSELERKLDLTQSTVSQHLARLRQGGLVASRHEGTTVYYSIASPEARAIVAAVYQAFCEPHVIADQ